MVHEQIRVTGERLRIMHLAGVVVADAAGRILLLHRATAARTQWEIPGGKIEEAELPIEAAWREASEELAADLSVYEEIGSELFYEDGHEILYTWFRAGIKAQEPVIGEPDKFDKLQYWSIDELLVTDEVLSPNTRNFVARVLSGDISVTGRKPLGGEQKCDWE